MWHFRNASSANLPTMSFQHVELFLVLANRQPLEIHAENTEPADST
jgi:hypothetical protein